jgi:hypothetical protein
MGGISSCTALPRTMLIAHRKAAAVASAYAAIGLGLKSSNRFKFKVS